MIPNFNLKLMQINTRSIRPKKEELNELINKENIDILSVNESWLKENMTFKLNNYKIERKDRKNNLKGGGVLIAIKNNIQYERIEEELKDEYSNTEYISINIFPKKNPLKLLFHQFIVHTEILIKPY